MKILMPVEIMNCLFIINGASGSGKSYFIKYLSAICSQKHISLKVIKKLTTRRMRQKEVNRESDNDLIYLSETEFNKINKSTMLFMYEYGGYKYGYYKDEIELSIETHDLTIVIIRDECLIRTMINRYNKVVNVITVFICVDKAIAVSRLLFNKYPMDKILDRTKRSNYESHDTVFKKGLYSHIVVNNYEYLSKYNNEIDLIINQYRPEGSN